MYRVVFPLSALGRYLAAGKDQPTTIDLTAADLTTATDGTTASDVIDLSNVPEQRAGDDQPAGKAGAQ
jgi:hypothetical protein